MAMVDKNDLALEGNLSTILQPVRGTNQYWYKVKGELKVVSAEFYFHKPMTVHLELYLFYCFIHFLLYIGQY